MCIHYNFYCNDAITFAEDDGAAAGVAAETEFVGEQRDAAPEMKKPGQGRVLRRAT